MIVPAGNGIEHVFQAVKTDTQRSEDQGILCFVSCGDADSVCTSQQLLNVFNKENLQFSQIPVESYEEIQTHTANLRKAQEVKTVILINCGATDDVRTLTEVPDNIRLVIIDNHRPVWHGHNVEDDYNTLVLVDDDDPVPKSRVPFWDTELDNDEPRDEEDESDEEEDEDEEDEGEGEDGDEPGTGQKRKREAAGLGGGSTRRSPATREQEAQERAERRRARAAEIDSYYSECNGYGKPSSVVLYSLCNKLNQDDFFHVWCAIVGLTEQLLFQQISKQQYNLWREQLETHVRAQQDDDAGQEEAIEAAAGIKPPNVKVAVEPCDDLRLTLLRQWTIEESLKYTSYVAARLQTWRQKGQDNIRSLLTYLCIPLKQATTSFRGLRDCFVEQLHANLPRFAPKHMLAWDALHMRSFRLRYMNEEVGASDFVFALLGLLTEPGRGEAAGEEAPPSTSGAARHGLPRTKAAFNRAVDALHVQRNLSLVQHGIACAKSLCQEVVSDCGLMLTQGSVHGGKNAPYRWLDMGAVKASNQRFTHPTVLRYMALFLRDASAHRFSGGDTRRPMVVAGPPDEHGTCCVVAVHAKHVSGNRLQNNPFAKPFIETVSALNVQSVRSAFDNCTYYMRKDQVVSFLSKLHDVVVEYQVQAEMEMEDAAAGRGGAPVPGGGVGQGLEPAGGVGGAGMGPAEVPTQA